MTISLKSVLNKNIMRRVVYLVYSLLVTTFPFSGKERRKLPQLPIEMVILSGLGWAGWLTAQSPDPGSTYRDRDYLHPNTAALSDSPSSLPAHTDPAAASATD